MATLVPVQQADAAGRIWSAPWGSQRGDREGRAGSWSTRRRFSTRRWPCWAARAVETFDAPFSVCKPVALASQALSLSSDGGVE